LSILAARAVGELVSRIHEYDVVRVRRCPPPDRIDGWRVNRRAPAVGDTGTVVDVLRAHGLPELLVVECSGPDGVDEWLAEFVEDELEIVDDPPVVASR
jgi:hypothetical protein